MKFKLLAIKAVQFNQRIQMKYALFILSFFTLGLTHAAVTVTPAAGGGSISADDEGGAYTSLTGPVIAESANGEIGVGTIILNAPSGAIFDIGGTAPTVLVTRIGGSGTQSRNINGVNTGTSIAITSISTTQITLTITNASTNGVTCSLTWQNVRVRPNTGIAGTGNITTSGTSSINGVTPGSTNFGTLTVVPGTFIKMQVLFPGETADPGSASGKTGTPTAQNAGEAVNFTVNAVDANWNIASSVHTIAITSSDANATVPANAALIAGTKTFSVTFKTAGAATVTASDFTDPGKTADTSPSITINAGAFSKLQLLMPGESAAPGTGSGKTGSPSSQTAGSSFFVTVNAVDDNWNIVNTITDVIGITSSDANASLPANAALVAGTETYSVTFKTAGSANVTATDITDGAKTSDTSPATAINAGPFTKMQLLVPGETAAPGTASGKIGTPSAQNLGTAFSITVNAVDDNWNVVSSTNTVGITSTDGTATLPSNAALVGGTKNFNITLNSNGAFTITATNISDGTKTADTSPSISIVSSILNVATGGSSISADNTGGSYTSLTGPAFTEGGNGDVGTGTIILNAPGGVIFDIGGTAPTLLMNRVGGSGADALNINGLADGSTIALTSITTSQITFVISTASSSGVTCKLTFQNVRVRPNTGAAGSGNLTKTGTSVMSGITNGTTNFGTITVIAGAFVKMQLLVPGETASPGSGSGKTGTPTAQSAGTSFNVTVNAVDAYWNVVSSANTIGITSSDINATLPGNAALVAGTQTFGVILKTVGAKTLTATNISDGTKTADTSPAITVNSGAFVKLQLLLPGETADPGTASGKTGTPTAQTAGTAFTVTVNAVDDAWNVVSSVHTIGITSTDANASLPSNAALVSGTQTFNITLKTAGIYTIESIDITDGTKTSNTSPALTNNAGAFTKMQLLVPGETASPGSATGKTGTPEAQSSTRTFTVTVNAVDANWNLVSSTNTIGITSSDGTATLPPNAALVGGTKMFSVTLNATGGTATITSTNISDGSKTADTSPPITLVLATWNTATGGSAISADNTGSTWTTLTGPVYNEGISGDVGTGTIILNAPSGVIFDIGGTAPTLLMTRLTGAGSNSRNINGIASGSSIAITSITATQITVTITSASNSGVTCRLTWQNVRVRPATGLAGSGNITKTGTSTMSGIYSTTNLGTMVVVAGAFAKMQLLVPGETAAPGSGSGKTGTPTAQTSGTAFNVTVNAVDQYWNMVSSVTNTAGITSSDINASLPANAALVAGTQTFSVTLKTGGAKTITVTNITDGTKTADTSPSITVNAGAVTKMQILVPGETAAPGTASGKTGTPTAQTAGASFSVTVNAVDANWNIVTSVINTAGITSTDVNATLPSNAALVAGTKNFTITLKTAGAKTITATNITDGTKTPNTSPTITVNTGAFTKMQILVPGETASAGSASGKTGSPNGQTPGTPFTVTVNAVDDNWNVVSSTNTVGITSSDGSATLPSNAALVAGTKSFSITLNTDGNWTITATNISDGTKTANTSPSITAGSVSWSGGAGTANWGDAANWSPVGVPISTNNINLTGANTIEINVDAVCKNLTLNNSGLSITIQSGKSLTISGNLTRTNGALTTTGNTTITFNGTIAQTITGSMTYTNLTISNTSGGVSVASGVQNLVGTLSLSGAGAFNTNNLLTLLSTSSATANIAALSTPANFTGNITMQRYVSGIQGYRYVGSAISNATLSGLTPEIRFDGFPGSTSPGYWCNTYTYNESVAGAFSNGWIPPSNITDPMSPGKGFAIYFYSINIPVTLDLTGPINKGNISLPVTYNSSSHADDGYNLVSNPYPSSIDWDAASGWTRTNIQGNTYYAWDDASQNYASYPAGGPGTNGGTQYIASSQGFIVKASAASPVLNMTENVKVATIPTPQFWKTSGSNFDSYAIKLKLKSNQNTYSDESVIRFINGATENKDFDYDALKITSTNPASPYLATLSKDSASLCINSYSEPSNSYSIPVSVKAGVSGTYTLSAEFINNFPGNTCFVLEDISTGNSMELNGQTAYSFSLAVTPTIQNRFLIHVSPPILSIQSVNVKCNGQSNGAMILSGNRQQTWSYNIKNNDGHSVAGKSGITAQSDTIFGLQAGIYTIESSDLSAFCNSNTETGIIDQPLPFISSISASDISCKGSNDGSAVVTISGGSSNYSITWSNGETTQTISNLPAGNYFATINDTNSCNITDSVTIVEGKAVDAIFTVANDSVYLSDGETNIQFNNFSTGGSSYYWTFDDNSSSTETNPYHTFTDTGIYFINLKVLGPNGCSDSVSHQISVLVPPVSLKEEDLESLVQVYSVKSKVIIEWKSLNTGTIQVRLLNNLGQAMYQSGKILLTKDMSHSIPLLSYAEGIYFVHIFTERNQLIKKINYLR